MDPIPVPATVIAGPAAPTSARERAARKRGSHGRRVNRAHSGFRDRCRSAHPRDGAPAGVPLGEGAPVGPRPSSRHGPSRALRCRSSRCASSLVTARAPACGASRVPLAPNHHMAGTTAGPPHGKGPSAPRGARGGLVNRLHSLSIYPDGSPRSDLAHLATLPVTWPVFGPFCCSSDRWWYRSLFEAAKSVAKSARVRRTTMAFWTQYSPYGEPRGGRVLRPLEPNPASTWIGCSRHLATPCGLVPEGVRGQVRAKSLMAYHRA